MICHICDTIFLYQQNAPILSVRSSPAKVLIEPILSPPPGIHGLVEVVDDGSFLGLFCFAEVLYAEAVEGCYEAAAFSFECDGRALFFLALVFDVVVSWSSAVGAVGFSELVDF